MRTATRDMARNFKPGTYLHSFFSEKEIPYKVFKVTDSQGLTHDIPNEVVVEAISQTRGSERKKIEDTLRKLDFRNGDVNHFLAHLAKGLAESYGGSMRFASGFGISRVRDGSSMTIESDGVYAHVWYDAGVAYDDYGRKSKDSGEWQVIISTSPDRLNLKPRGKELARKTFRFVEPRMRSWVLSEAEDFIGEMLVRHKGRRLATMKSAYYTVLLDPGSGEWQHPTKVLSRGAFDTEREAHAWAKKQIPGVKYRVKEIKDVLPAEKAAGAITRKVAHLVASLPAGSEEHRKLLAAVKEAADRTSRKV